jgi:hypothetical protein
MRELRLTEPMVWEFWMSRNRALMFSGLGQRAEVVLESTARRRGHMGSIRAVQDW